MFFYPRSHHCFKTLSSEMLPSSSHGFPIDLYRLRKRLILAQKVRAKLHRKQLPRFWRSQINIRLAIPFKARSSVNGTVLCEAHTKGHDPASAVLYVQGCYWLEQQAWLRTLYFGYFVCVSGNVECKDPFLAEVLANMAKQLSQMETASHHWGSTIET